ncbi:MAG: hypothetical protein PHN31_02225 [Candidatus Gracilibacteria bacterium]|nr:hypothetical protein [Candidatus Gracilibacteria bacterium]
MFENEKIVETKNCRQCQTTFEITDKDLEFYEKVSPSFGGDKYIIPTPTLCPECRQQRRLSFRNERKLYKRICDATGKPIISIFSPNKSFKVYNQEFWWSDKWNPLDYGRDFDFNKTFFEQFGELVKVIPRESAFTKNMTNSPYSNFESDEKDCYLTVGGHYNENCMYGTYYVSSKNSMDGYWGWYIENCYETVNVMNCFNCKYIQYCENCSSCDFCYDCIGCTECIGCVGLRNKKYCIYNKQYSKDEYKNIINENNIIGKKNYNNLLLNHPRRSTNIIGSSNCIGNDILNSKNCSNCFYVEESEDCRNCFIIGKIKNAVDITSVGYSEVCYELCSSNDLYGGFACFSCWGGQNICYCDICYDCVNCFGCVGLSNKEYCIFNKQYIKDEYQELVQKIIKHMIKTGEWGEFFPVSISPFGYNETVAQEYFPLKKEESILKGFNWSDYEQPIPKVDKIIQALKLPNNIKEIPDDILNRAIECEITKKPFRIIKQELDFYRKHNLPIPKRHPEQRHLDRMILRNPRKLYDRKCDKCKKDIKTTYSPERPEIVYCEDCYDKEIY